MISEMTEATRVHGELIPTRVFYRSTEKSMKTLLATLLFLFASPSLAEEYSGAPWGAMKDDSRLRELLVDHSALKDPFSAQFRQVEVRVIDLEGGATSTAWCGELNAKNGMGAYSGWSRFYATTGFSGDSPTVSIEDQRSSSMFSIMVKMHCSGSRLAPVE